MKVLSQKRFPVFLGKPGHYSVPLDGGLLVDLAWQYSWDRGPTETINRATAMKLRKSGYKPIELHRENPHSPEQWQILTVGQQWSWATIKVYHYGQRVNYYAGGSESGRGTEYLSDLQVKNGWELRIGERVIRIEQGPAVIKKIRSEAFGECSYPKYVLVELLS